MADWAMLPYEVLNEIFNDLGSSRYIYKCLMVCKNWYRPARYCMYKHLYFSNDIQVRKFLTAIERPQNGNYELVSESVDIHRLHSRMSWIELFKKCANLKSISHSGEREKYELIKSMRMRNSLKKIQFLAAPDRYSMKDYIECAIQLRAQLKRLDIIEIVNWSFSPVVFTTLYSQLDQFTHLEHLYLEKASELNKIDPLIDSCKALKSLELKLYKPQSMRQFGFPELDEDPQAASNQELDYAKLVARPGIRTAKLHFVTITPKIIEYIYYKFPKLRHLELDQSIPPRDPIKLSNAIMLSLLLAIKNSYRVGLPLIFEVDDAFDVIAKFLVVAKFTGSVEIVYRYVTSTRYRLDNPLIAYGCLPPRRSLRLQYYKGIAQENEPLRGPTVIPHLTLISVVGTHLKKLVIDGLDNQFVHGTVNSYYLIDYTLNLCPFLTHMGFVNCCMAHLPLGLLPVPHIFMESLNFENCDLNCEAFIKLSLILPRLKNVVMKNCNFTSYITKRQPNASIRRSIAMHFPFSNFQEFQLQNIQQYRPLSKIYLKLTVGTSVFYKMYTRGVAEPDTMTEKYFFAPKQENDSLHIEFLCKSMGMFLMN